MLSPADVQLIKSDKALGGLETLLDLQQFGPALAKRYPDMDVSKLAARYIRYKPGTSCLVGYSLDGGAGPLDLYARTHTQADADKVEKALQRVRRPSSGPGIATVANGSILCFPFPNDHELRCLPALMDCGTRPQLMQSLLPLHPHLWGATLTPLRYKPERRFVARIGDGQQSALLRLLTRSDFAIISDTARTFDSDPPLQIPHRLGKSKDQYAIAVEWINGRVLTDFMSLAELPLDAFGQVGVALARFHRQKPKRIRRVRSAQMHTQLVVDAAASLQIVLPDAGLRAQVLASRIADRLLSRHWRSRRAIHGDFAADQVIVGAEGIAIIDLDRAEYGDPHIDLASFRARMLNDVSRGQLEEAAADICFETMLASYIQTGQRDVSRKLPTFVAASLLQLAIEPFRLRTPNWPEHIHTLIDIAEHQLEASHAAA